MRTSSAIAGSALFFIAAPGVVAGLIPSLLLGSYDRPLAPTAYVAIGMLAIVLAITVLVYAFASFALEGGGTPAPVAPTERLVIGGVYRFVRNPMYVAVVTIILGQALVFTHWPLAGYAALVGATTFSFVKVYEEPVLRQRYGAQYADYCRSVP